MERSTRRVVCDLDYYIYMRKTPYEKLLTKINRTISSVEGLEFSENKILISE